MARNLATTHTLTVRFHQKRKNKAIQRKNTNIEKGFENEKKYQEKFINNRKKQLEFTGRTEKGITQTIENENKERLKNSIKASEYEINLLKTKNQQ